MGNIRIPADYKKKVNRSVKNLSLAKRTTLHPGEIIPIYSRRCMAGSRYTVDVNSLLASQPLVSKLLGTFRLQVGIFYDSDSNYYGWLDNNKKYSTQELLQKTRHRKNLLSRFEMEEGGLNSQNAELYFNGQYNNFRGSVLDYMGVPSGIVLPYDETGDFPDSALGRLDLGFILTYLNIFRNYYASKQEQNFPYIQTSKFRDTATDPIYMSFNHNTIAQLDDFFMALRNSTDGIDFDSGSLDSRLLWFVNDYLPTLFNPHGGILLSTYLPDLYRNLLDDTFNTSVSRVSTAGNSFSIDTFRFQNKLQRLIDRFDVSGGRFSDWLRTVWGVATRKDMDIPELIGVSQQVVDPNQVTAQSSGEGVDLGQFGGNFNKLGNHRKHSFVASTPGRLMVCLTLIPEVDYSQGIDPEIVKVNFADDFYPEFEQLGYQKVPGYVYSPNVPVRIVRGGTSSAPTYTVEEDKSEPWLGLSSVGKQVAWLDLQTDVNRVHGEFGNGGYYQSWILRRRFFHRFDSFKVGEQGKVWTEKLDITHYINPLDYQYPFVGQSLDDPNWELQVGIGNRAVLPIGKRYMPNLE